MTDAYDLQRSMTGKRVTGKSNPLTVDEIRDDKLEIRKIDRKTQ
jgi:hypothetical protein